MAFNQLRVIDIGRGQFMMADLPKITSWKTGQRPGKPKRGTLGFNSQTSQLEFFDGTAWFTASMSSK